MINKSVGVRPSDYHEDLERRRKFKSARLIVRNLPFTSTEENLKEHFSKCGNVAEINLLKKENGLLVGCCFVQYEQKLSAVKAIAQLSGKPFLGRVIVVDWALPKGRFLMGLQPNQGISKNEGEGSKNPNVEIKTEPDDIKEESQSSEEGDEDDEKPEVSKLSNKYIKEENDDSNSEEDEDGDENSSEDGEESLDEEDKEDIKTDVKNLSSKRFSNDVSEGKTVFIKNVPFSATEEDLKKAVTKFGRVYYVKICVDSLTEHSKGTAFVKFLTKESAEKCLAAGTEFELDGTVLDPHPALPRKSLSNNTNKSKQPADSRNLFLLKEGVVAAGSKAAEGVSEKDMAKRLQLEKWKREIVKDLGKFVSKTRLVVHNLPVSVDDKRLRSIVLNNAPKNSQVKEVKIMRDLKNFDMTGKALSKGFGFVSFSRHEDALSTLRQLNNNPSVFKAHRRPIVSFSVESKKALNIKQLRLEKSKKPKATEAEPVIKVEGDSKRKRKKKKKKADDKRDQEKPNKMTKSDENKEEIPYIGMTATPGVKKFMNNLDTKKQALLHKSSLKKVKAKLKQQKRARLRQMNIKQKNQRRQPVKEVEDKEFSNMVKKYKLQINSAGSKKWFE